MMRIALFTDFYFEENPLSLSVKLLKKAYEAEGHEVYVLTAAQKKEKESKVFSFTSAHIKQYPQFRLSLSPFLSAKKIVSGLDADVIHNMASASMAMAAATCAKDLEIPSISTVIEALPQTASNLSSGRFSSILQDAAKKYTSWMYSFFDELVYPSNFSKTILREYTHKDGDVIPFPVEAYKLEGRPRNIGYVLPFEHKIYAEELLRKADGIKNRVGKELQIFYINEKNGSKNALQFNERYSAYKKLSLFIEPANVLTFSYYGVEFLQAGGVAIAHKDSALSEFLAPIDSKLVYSSSASLLDSISYALQNKSEIIEKLKALEMPEINAVSRRYLDIYKSLK